MHEIPEVGDEIHTREGQIFVVDQITFRFDKITLELQDKRVAILQSTINLETLERLWDTAVRMNLVNDLGVKQTKD